MIWVGRELRRSSSPACCSEKGQLCVRTRLLRALFFVFLFFFFHFVLLCLVLGWSFWFGLFSLWFRRPQEGEICLHFHVALQSPGNLSLCCKLGCFAAFRYHQPAYKGWIKTPFAFVSASPMSTERRDPDFLPRCPHLWQLGAGQLAKKSAYSWQKSSGCRAQKQQLLRANWPPPFLATSSKALKNK